jgi:hypothetical protein
MGLAAHSGTEFPTLKRGANERCAYGAGFVGAPSPAPNCGTGGTPKWLQRSLKPEPLARRPRPEIYARQNREKPESAIKRGQLREDSLLRSEVC